jgi:hypothetical protein
MMFLVETGKKLKGEKMENDIITLIIIGIISAIIVGIF